MATTHTQIISMAWGTFIDVTNVSVPQGGQSYMRLRNGQLPLIKFNNDAFHGIMLSATLNLYCSVLGGPSGFSAYRVIRPADLNAHWYNATATTSWGGEACSAASDRTFTKLTQLVPDMALGWNAIPISNLPELQAVLDGLDLILLADNASGFEINTIEKSPVPYLAITYTTSLLGGIQIF